MQSRYYNPEMGRFINADEYASTGQGALGYNMYAYCGNNPVINIDLAGYRYVAATTVHGESATDRSTSCQYQNSISQSKKLPTTTNQFTSTTGTLSLGISGSVGIGPWAVGGQASITFDSQGYAALQYGTSGGLSVDAAPVGFGLSVAPFIMVTNAPTYDALEGPGIQVGAAAPAITVDYNAMLDASGEKILYQGVSIGLGVAVPNFHVMWGDTYTFSAMKVDWFNFLNTVQ